MCFLAYEILIAVEIHTPHTLFHREKGEIFFSHFRYKEYSFESCETKLAGKLVVSKANMEWDGLVGSFVIIYTYIFYTLLFSPFCFGLFI